MDVAGKKVAVLGLGRSGTAAARFLFERRARLVLIDRDHAVGRNPELPPGELHLGAEDPWWLAGCTLLVTSPGVPRDNRLLAHARRIGIPVWSELELAARFFHRPMVAITGTNGKSTVTVMIGEIFKAAGQRAFVGGNLGVPLIEATRGAYDLGVIEVSSYQLEWIEDFHPRVGVYLNLSEDHLDRYRDLEDYGRAKAALFRNQNFHDWALLNRDDPRVIAIAPSLRAKVVSFGCSTPAEGPSLHIENDAIVYRLESRVGEIALGEVARRGRHHQMNAMAAAGAALAMEVEAPVIERALAEFKGLPHRIELVRERGGVKFIDDSKGTNVGAVVEALAAADGPVLLIAGGMDKGGDYKPLLEPLRAKVRRLILIGAARDKMAAALAGATEISTVTTLAEAVELATAAARPGETVMLSPACSSFDQFKDYAQRGDIFKELVRAL
ncbi:MAG TPA: UDP-N-acetylmuramoyl-L-alanine--D-glutamate ligase [Candidatus Binataceae bacterium]|nr:UDP-N-acetylmuramoyl-L-alanine--D-glutamate ligase [Candidatus Binataceae bacterium]